MSLKEGEKLTLCSNIIHILGAFYMSVFFHTANLWKQWSYNMILQACILFTVSIVSKTSLPLDSKSQFYHFLLLSLKFNYPLSTSMQLEALTSGLRFWQAFLARLHIFATKLNFPRLSDRLCNIMPSYGTKYSKWTR